jgi:hypothetical protein
MTCRTEDGVTFKQEYNTENRISSIIRLASRRSRAFVAGRGLLFAGELRRQIPQGDDVGLRL